MQAEEVKDTKHDKEVTEKSEQFHLELGVEGVTKKRKGNKMKHLQRKLPLALSHQDEFFNVKDN